MTTNDIIKKAEEKFREKFPTLYTREFITDKINSYTNCEKDVESLLATTIREAITEAFKATEVEEKTFGGYDGEKIVNDEKAFAFNDALFEVKKEQEDFMK